MPRQKRNMNFRFEFPEDHYSETHDDTREMCKCGNFIYTNAERENMMCTSCNLITKPKDWDIWYN